MELGVLRATGTCRGCRDLAPGVLGAGGTQRGLSRGSGGGGVCRVLGATGP